MRGTREIFVLVMKEFTGRIQTVMNKALMKAFRDRLAIEKASEKSIDFEISFQ